MSVLDSNGLVIFLVASVIQSTVGAINTAILITLGDAIPLNYSLNTGRYCTRFNNRLTYKDFLLKLSNLLPILLLQSVELKK